MSQDSVITQQMRDAVGVFSQPIEHDIEKGAIRRFAEVIGDPNPLYCDEERARKSRYGGIIAPPTFLRTLETDPLNVDFGVPYEGVFDGGSEWKYHEPVRLGDRITVTSRIVDLRERTGRVGPMLFVISESTYVNQFGAKVALQRNTLIYYQPSGEKR